MRAIKCDRCGKLCDEQGDHRKEVELLGPPTGREGLRGFRVSVLVSPIVWDRDRGHDVSDLDLCADCLMDLASKAGEKIDTRPRIAAAEPDPKVLLTRLADACGGVTALNLRDSASCARVVRDWRAGR